MLICLLMEGGGGTPSSPGQGVPHPVLTGGTSIQALTPSLIFDGGTPHPDLGWGNPCLDLGWVLPLSADGVPPLRCELTHKLKILHSPILRMHAVSIRLRVLIIIGPSVKKKELIIHVLGSVPSFSFWLKSYKGLLLISFLRLNISKFISVRQVSLILFHWILPF